MSFDPNREDYERLGLGFAMQMEPRGGFSLLKAHTTAARFASLFASDRDSLPTTDEDRAFHLVANAATIIDYDLPFATEEKATELISRGHELLREALVLDPKCYDALRMQMAADISSFEGYYNFLSEHAVEVDDARKEREGAIRARVESKGLLPEHLALALNLARRPYLRWLATLAERALICGRNRETIELCEKALALDPADQADVRFTEALALAKLEDDKGLDDLVSRTKPIEDVSYAPHGNAWYQLARIALAHRRYDLDLASHLLDTLFKSYPSAVVTLGLQHELPDGVFARLACAERSEDELVLAVSEATVLLQEGREQTGRGVLGAWIHEHAMQVDPVGIAAAEAEIRRWGEG